MNPRRIIKIPPVFLLIAALALVTSALAQEPGQPEHASQDEIGPFPPPLRYMAARPKTVEELLASTPSEMETLRDRIINLRAEIDWLELDQEALRQRIIPAISKLQDGKEIFTKIQENEFNKPLQILRAMDRLTSEDENTEASEADMFIILQNGLDSDEKVKTYLEKTFEIDLRPDVPIEEAAARSLRDKNVELPDDADVFQALVKSLRRDELDPAGTHLPPDADIKAAWVKHKVDSQIQNDRAKLRRSRSEFLRRARTLAHKRLDLEDLERQYRTSTNPLGGVGPEPAP